MNNETLSKIAQYLDISPSDFQRAQERFSAVKDWLDIGKYKSGYLPDVYLQGSFRLGTVVRPYYKDKDGDFDIDQVCELTKRNVVSSPKILKHDIGDRLKENDNYERMLDDEGKRCWTLEYASEDGRPGFHIDVLPALPAEKGSKYKIDITHKEHSSYFWSTSNPKGYYLWFKSKNSFTSEFMESQRNIIYQSNKDLYTTSKDVPKQLFRTPLQRAIQIMKRHRDVYFSEKKNKPISIIITTISTQKFKNNNIFGIIEDFIEYITERNKFLIKNGYLEIDGVLDFCDGEWLIPNPVDYGMPEDQIENFADKWNLNAELPQAFFEWVYQLKRDLWAFKKSGLSVNLNLRTKEFGEGEVYSKIIRDQINERLKNNLTSLRDEDDLLQLIHLGIEERMDWNSIEQIALSYFRKTEGLSNDVAKVNFYQIAIHRGRSLSSDALKDVKKVLQKNNNSAAFVMCCNLLLGTETQDMIKQCIKESPLEKVLEWPIMRLSKHPYLLPKENW